MVNRRSLLTLLSSGVMGGFLGGHVDASAAQPRSDNGVSPHSIALGLVFRTQQPLIARLESDYFRSCGADDRKGYKALADSYWWHDIQDRQWSVRRPFYPGLFDSTHWLLVTYSMSGKWLATWSVDTRKDTVVVSKTCLP